MAKNILFSGLSYSKTNAELMEAALNKNGITNVMDFGPYTPYKNMSDEEIVKRLCEDFDSLAENSDVNIICHSMGCNIGLILAKKRCHQIKKAAFLSPELQKTTRQEKKVAKLMILNSTTAKHDISQEQPVNLGIFDKISLFNVFNQTRKLAIESLENIDNLDSFVAYGVADQFVSPKGAEELAYKLNAKLIQAKTRHHNLLLSNAPAVCVDYQDKSMSKSLKI